MGKTLNVPRDYPSISDAIMKAKDGDTIQVESGNYSGIKVEKTLKIVAFGSDIPGVDGVSLTGDGVTFRGFMINGDFIVAGNYNDIEDNIFLGGILNVSGNFNRISGNILNYTSAHLGYDVIMIGNSNVLAANHIFSWLGGVKFGGSDNRITGNRIMVAGAVRDGLIFGVNYGVRGWGPRCNISSNTIISEMDGIVLINDGQENSEEGIAVINNTIISESGVAIIVDSFLNYSEPSHNQISKNSISGSTAISIADSDDNIITENIITGRDSGISLETGENNLVAGNTIKWMQVGLMIGRWSDNNSVIGNTIENCNIGLIEYNYRSQNQIFLNNFVENGVNAYDVCLAVWNKNGKGNYWSNFIGPDDNTDGIVDKQYVLDGNAGSLDMYPLANPIVWTYEVNEP